MSRQFKITVNGREYDVAVLEVTPGSGQPPAVAASPAPDASLAPGPAKAAPPIQTGIAAASGDEVAQMGGVVVQVEVKVGQMVAIGDRLMVLEAMKMKTHLLASRAGQVTRVLAAAGDAVEGGQPLVTIQ